MQAISPPQMKTRSILLPGVPLLAKSKLRQAARS